MNCPAMERDVLPVILLSPDLETRKKPHAEVSLEELVKAIHDVVQRNEIMQQYVVHGESLSVRERMSIILDSLQENREYVAFTSFYSRHEGKAGMVVTVLAILELARGALVDVIQNQPYEMIYVRTG